MTIYILNLILIIIYDKIFKKLKKGRGIYIVVISIQLFCILALRGFTVGVDLDNYIAYYKIIGQMPLTANFMGIEKGYVLYNSILGHLSSDPRFFFVITSAALVVGISKFIYDYSKIPWLSYFLFITLGFYAIDFGLLRQALAIIIVINGFKYVENGKFWKFGMCIVLATLFHSTASFCILIYFLRYLKFTIPNILAMLVCSGFIYISRRQIISFFLPFASNDYSQLLISGEGYGMLLMLSTITILSIVFGKKLIVEESRITFQFYVLLTGIVLQLLAAGFSLFSRIVFYFSIIIIAFIPEIIEGQEDKKLKWIATFCVVGLCLFFYIYGLNSDGNTLVPYLFMWE